MKFKKRKR